MSRNISIEQFKDLWRAEDLHINLSKSQHTELNVSVELVHGMKSSYSACHINQTNQSEFFVLNSKLKHLTTSIDNIIVNFQAVIGHKQYDYQITYESVIKFYKDGNRIEEIKCSDLKFEKKYKKKWKESINKIRTQNQSIRKFKSKVDNKLQEEWIKGNFISKMFNFCIDCAQVSYMYIKKSTVTTSSVPYCDIPSIEDTSNGICNCEHRLKDIIAHIIVMLNEPNDDEMKKHKKEQLNFDSKCRHFYQCSNHIERRRRRSSVYEDSPMTKHPDECLIEEIKEAFITSLNKMEKSQKFSHSNYLFLKTLLLMKDEAELESLYYKKLENLDPCKRIFLHHSLMRKLNPKDIQTENNLICHMDNESNSQKIQNFECNLSSNNIIYNDVLTKKLASQLENFYNKKYSDDRDEVLAMFKSTMGTNQFESFEI